MSNMKGNLSRVLFPVFPSIHTLNVDLILELSGAFLDQTELFLGPGVGSKTVLGSTHMY